MNELTPELSTEDVLALSSLTNDPAFNLEHSADMYKDIKRLRPTLNEVILEIANDQKE